jgi:hypothetical protein
MHEACKLTRLIQASNSVLMMIRDTRAAHDQVLTYLASEQSFLRIPKEEEDPVRYMSMLIPTYISYQWYYMFLLQRTGTQLVTIYNAKQYFTRPFTRSAEDGLRPSLEGEVKPERETIS